MITHSTPAESLAYQGDLFDTNPVINKAKKLAAGRADPNEELSLFYGSVRIIARKYVVRKRTVYHVVFADRRTPIVLTVALRQNGESFWTSVPEGRQREAEEIGALIDSAAQE